MQCIRKLITKKLAANKVRNVQSAQKSDSVRHHSWFPKDPSLSIILLHQNQLRSDFLLPHLLQASTRPRQHALRPTGRKCSCSCANPTGSSWLLLPLGGCSVGTLLTGMLFHTLHRNFIRLAGTSSLKFSWSTWARDLTFWQCNYISLIFLWSWAKTKFTKMYVGIKPLKH